MDEIGLPIYGTPADAIDEAEDRERFDELLERCGIPRPAGRTVFTLDEALQAAQEVGYPVLMRPSYVLGGQNMIVAYKDVYKRQQEDNQNFLLMHAVGVNVSGQIASVIAGGMILTLFA